jgi:hypothetical protein
VNFFIGGSTDFDPTCDVIVAETRIVKSFETIGVQLFDGN